MLETRGGEKKERSYTSWIKGVKDDENLGYCEIVVKLNSLEGATAACTLYIIYIYI